MKQCPKCGFIVTDTDPSCFNCGLKFPPAEDKQHELKQSSIPNDIAQEVPEQAQPEQTQKYKQFCSRCGKPNTSKGKFCVVCGNSLLHSTAQPEQAQPEQPQPEQPQPIYQQPVYNYAYAQPKKKGLSVGVILLIILAPIALIAIIGFTMIGNMFDSAETNANISTSSAIRKSSSEINSKEASSSPSISKEDFIAQCQEYGYKDVARDPKDYIGKKAKFIGEVIQVIEANENVALRVNITKNEYDFWEDTIYVVYTRSSDTESRILEDDIINIYGTLDGLKTYTTVLGDEISIPKVIAEYIDIA